MSAPTIGPEALSGTAITSFIVPDNYAAIGVGALANCSSLTTITLGDGITFLPANFTTGSTGLQNVTLGSNVTEVDSTAFEAPFPVLSFSGDATNPDVINALVTILSTVSVTNLIFTNPAMTAAVITDAAAELEIPLTLPSVSQLTFSGTVVTGYTGTMAGPLVIPEGITEIADNAFQLTDITNVKLPSTLETIGNFAFDQCASLKYLDLGGAVTIGEAAFGSCGSLVSVVIPDSVTTIELSAFSFCTSLESVKIGNGVTVLGSDSDALETGQWGIFYGCTNLKTVVFPSSLTEIGSFTFGFTALVNVVIPSTVTSIGISIFLGCPNLFSVTLPPSGLTTIPDGAFEGCPSLQTVKLGTGITTIGMNAFNICPSLKDFVHSDGSRKTTVPASVTTIGLGAFTSCGFTEFTVPSTVTTLGEYIFYACTLLKSATVHMTEIPPNMFSGCQALTKVIFKAAVTVIGQGAFAECTSLTTFEFPNTLQTLSWFAFSGAGLTSITLPNSLIGMNPNVFVNCASLTDINFGTGLTEIVAGTFTGCTALSNVTLPSLITSVLPYGFAECTSLTDIDMPNVTTLGQGVFYNCSSLTNVSMPNTTSVGGLGFQNCTSLVTIDMPAVTYIDQRAFIGCTSLSDVTFSPSMTIIDPRNQFLGCTSLTTLPTNYPNSGKNIDTMLRVFGYPGLFTSTFTENTLYTDLSSTSNALTMTVGYDPAPSAEGTLCDVTITLSTPKQGFINFFGKDYDSYVSINAPIDGTTTNVQMFVYGEWNYIALFSGGGEQSYTLITH